MRLVSISTRRLDASRHQLLDRARFIFLRDHDLIERNDVDVGQIGSGHAGAAQRVLENGFLLRPGWSAR